jgi:hypothetical protein
MFLTAGLVSTVVATFNPRIITKDRRMRGSTTLFFLGGSGLRGSISIPGPDGGLPAVVRNCGSRVGGLVERVPGLSRTSLDQLNSSAYALSAS